LGWFCQIAMCNLRFGIWVLQLDGFQVDIPIKRIHTIFHYGSKFAFLRQI
jgi:hypothetical protein